MAYVLGFVVADGCIILNKNRKKNPFTFNITSVDLEHLYKIKKVLESEHKISNKSGSTNNPAYQIQIRNSVLANDLMKLGIFSRKTHNLNSIKVPDKYFSDFARGFFDGDGSVYTYKVNGTPQIKVGFVSTSLSFLIQFNKQLCRNLKIALKSVHKTTNQESKKMIQFNTHFYIDDCEKLYKFMYKNASIFLDRKYRIFKKWENIKSKNRRTYIKQNYPSKIGWRLNQRVLA
jgi:intein-encoded DNA endonuclease-like protein